MQHLRLRSKIIIGAIGIIVFLMTISIAVAAFIINSQYRKASKRQLNQSITILHENLGAMETKLLEAARQMAKVNDMGAKTQFLADEKNSNNPLMTRPTYREVVQTLYNVGLTANIWKTAVYDIEGDLLGFAVIDKEEALIGYPQRGGELFFEAARIEPGKQLQEGAWRKISAVENIQMKFAGPSQGDTVTIRAMEKFIGLAAAVDIKSLVFNEKTETLEQGKIGRLVALQKLDRPFVEKNVKLSGMDINIFQGKHLSVGSLSGYKILNASNVPNTVRDQWRWASQKPFFGDASDDADEYFQALLPIYQNGAYTGSIAALYPKRIARMQTLRMVMYLCVAAFACMALIFPLTFFFSNSLLRTVKSVVVSLKDIAEGEGDLTHRLNIQTKDEIGELASWFNSFVDQLHRVMRHVTEDAQNLNASSLQLTEVSGKMSKAAEDTSHRAAAVSKAVEQMNTNMTSVAAAMEQTSANTESVTGASQELTATIREIAEQSERARRVSGKAVDEAHMAGTQVTELGRAANEIGMVTEAITEISEQTNLLALNATIEASRAGEAGKGFAVVANEIKALARQTANSTTEIKNQISGIQSSTEMIVGRITTITQVIDEVNEIVSAIAAAIEEQSVTTNEIAENVGQASKGIQAANENVSISSSVADKIYQDVRDFTVVASDMSVNSIQVADSAKALAALAARLSQTVGRFKL